MPRGPLDGVAHRTLVGDAFAGDVERSPVIDGAAEIRESDGDVDGTIELERLDNVVFVGRPAFGQDNSTVGLFKIVSGSSEAVRTPVQLGRSSVNTIEIKNGLQPGDQVILSDTSAWDSHDRIRLN